MRQSAWSLGTGRLLMTPVAFSDLPAIAALKADPRVYGMMLGGVRTRAEAAADLAEDMRCWGRLGVGMWTVRARGTGRFLGLVGFHERPDGRGIGLRFALEPGAQGQGYAPEAAGAALRFAHDRAGIARVVAVARETNFGSRQVLGAIGMREAEAFQRDGHRMLVFESVRGLKPDAA
jgi:RimJ/RimL family protein N-acetyltransferase